MARNGVAGDGGRSGEKPLDFLTNQPVEGKVLSRKLASGGLPLRQALQYAIDAGNILNTAHSAGRFHGSLSPDFVVIANTGARLIKPPDAPSVEAAEFCAPERIRGEAPDRGSDIFAFGALLRWLIGRTGGACAESLDRLIATLTEPDPLRRPGQIRHAVLELRIARSLLWDTAPARNNKASPARRSPGVPAVARASPCFWLARAP